MTWQLLIYLYNDDLWLFLTFGSSLPFSQRHSANTVDQSHCHLPSYLREESVLRDLLLQFRNKRVNPPVIFPTLGAE